VLKFESSSLFHAVFRQEYFKNYRLGNLAASILLTAEFPQGCCFCNFIHTHMFKAIYSLYFEFLLFTTLLSLHRNGFSSGRTDEYLPWEVKVRGRQAIATSG
jgi:hypothetical protein